MDKNKKIPTYFIGLCSRNGVVTQHFNALAQQLAKKGIQVIVIVDEKKYELENHNSNPEYYVFPSKVPKHLKDLLFLLRLIRKYQPSCVVSVFRLVNIMTIASWLAHVPQRVVWYRTTSNQSIYELDGPSKIKRVYQIFRKRIVYKLSTKIITSTKAMKKDLRKVYGVSEKKVEIFPNSIADPGNISTQLPKYDKKLVCVGRLCNLKGQETLIRAIALLKSDFPDLQVLFLGGGDLEKYRMIAYNLGVEKNCRFEGKVSHEMVLENMATSTITIVPSKDEAFGYVNIESMSLGIPVIASNVGGIPEVIRDGIDGLLIQPDDPDILAKSIYKLLIDSALRKRMGLNARERFLNNFEQKNNIEQQVAYLTRNN